MLSCPNSGCEVDEFNSIYSECKTNLVHKNAEREASKNRISAISPLQKSLGIVLKKPLVSITSLLGAFISISISLLIQIWFVPIDYWRLTDYHSPELLESILISSILGLAGSFFHISLTLPH